MVLSSSPFFFFFFWTETSVSCVGTKPWVGVALGPPLSPISKSFAFHKVTFIIFFEKSGSGIG